MTAFGGSFARGLTNNTNITENNKTGGRRVDVEQRVEATEKELDAFIERRSRTKDPEEEHELWKASEQAHRERRRQENRAAWCDYFGRLADVMRTRAEDYDRRAAALLEDGRNEGGTA